MPWIIAAVLVLLWALGLATSYTWSGLIHLALFAAAALVVVHFVRRPRRASQTPESDRGEPR